MFELTREWRFYLTDMISFAEKVQTYTYDLDQIRFEASGLNYDATLRNLELIGEAAPIFRMISGRHIPIFLGV